MSTRALAALVLLGAATTASSAPTFVGGAKCAGCHAQEAERWHGSHHDLAMQVADEQSVLGNFDGATFTHRGVTSRFSRRDGKFFVRTDGADGRLHDYEIAYTFGVAPLQQYLVRFPGGRYQALGIAWDGRPRPQGGQRWFHLYPDEKFRPDDPLHWTGRLQTWNHMCAECHSTGVEKGYDPASGGYRTTWKEIDVSCEACHGPGSEHVADPTKGLAIALDERRGVEWAIDPASGNARRSVPRTTDREIQMCARCHARRSELFENYRWGRPLMDTHLPALLTDGLYRADGQLEAEVYEYGSFLQSKMHAQGVTCSDCHEPHGAKTRTPGNGVCLQCHLPTKYEAATHHFHRPGSAGSRCVDCHMPVETYMRVDPRHDHGFRIPRPDLSVRLGTPNACNECHRDRKADWAAGKIREWFGHQAGGHQRFAEALHAARSVAVDAPALLSALVRAGEQPAIARATAATALGRWLDPAALGVLAPALRDPDPLVRHGAMDALEPLPRAERSRLAQPLLDDPIRTVRVGAASLLADVPPAVLPAPAKAALERAVGEYLAAQRQNADQPEAQTNLGNFLAKRGDTPGAEAAYRRALELDRDWVPAYVNLADVLRQAGRDEEGEKLLRDGLRRLPDAAALHHSLGLLLVRQKKLDAALTSLGRAAELAPDDARFSYVYAVGLDGAGNRARARDVVAAALRRMPGDPSLNALRAQLANDAEH